MNFVNRHGRVQPITLGTVCKPCSVFPLMLIDVDYDGSIVGTFFGGEAIWIRFKSPEAEPGADFKFIDRSFAKPRNKNFPDPGFAAQAHRVDASVPQIEIADDAHTLRIRGPHTKVHPTHVGNFANVRTKLFVLLIVSAFTGKIEIVVSE